MEDVGVSNRELEAESHRAEMLTQENVSLKSQLEELHRRLSGGEEVDSPANIKQQLKQVKEKGFTLHNVAYIIMSTVISSDHTCT